MPTFDEIRAQVSVLLQREGRVAYRILKRQFTLTDEDVEDLKADLIDAKRLAVDEDGKVLVWLGEGQSTAARTTSPLPPQSPASYTPPHLAERIRAEQSAMEARGDADGERKTITALFADIQDSTALIEDLDPEAARRLIDPALQLMMDAVHRYEGFVVQPTGDGIFALFGAPLAHEDHPQRALFAALLMQADSKRYAERLRREQGLNLQIRVGVNTGEVVLRSIRKDDLHTDYTPVGHSIHLAARMESLASGGAVVVSEGTYKLIAGYFECKALGAAKVKGVTEPIPIYEVLGVGPLRTRLQVSARRGFTRFVGRQSELAQMQKALEQVKAGHGQLVGVRGEPGLGKSRLFYEFRLTASSGCLVLEAYSVSYGKASPYLPVIELLKSYFQLQPQDDERQRKAKVMGQVLTLDRSLEDSLPYLFALLGIEEQPSPLQQMDPQIRRRRTFEALKKLFLRESLNQPLVLIFEDLHWIDSETQGFLDTFSEGVASAQVLLLVNYRPEYRHEWGTKTYYTQLRLAPLGTEEAAELLTFLLGSDMSLTTVKQLILDKTEGTPFFMEEVVQTLAEEDALVGERGHYRVEKTPTALHISPTVQGVLAARIDRLDTAAKELLQHLAVLGREFSLSLVRHVVPQPEAELYQLLSTLRSKEFLYEQPAFPEVEYIFKHALTQEVAYGSVLHERRKAIHERTAQAIEALYSATLDEHYSELAHHYTHSGNTEKAIEYLHLAGQQAVQRSSYVEAITHLRTALELLTTLPDTRERAQQELRLHLASGVPLGNTQGWSAPEVGHACTRAYELCQHVGNSAQFFSALRGLSGYYLVRGEVQKSRELGDQLLSSAQSTQDPLLLLYAHDVLGISLYWLGEFAPARLHLEQSLALYDPQHHHSAALRYGGADPGVRCHAYLSLTLWALGAADHARQSIHAALTLARDLAHAYSVGFALNWAARLSQLRREEAAAQEQAEGVIRLATEQGFTQLLALSTGLRGWALAEQGQREEGLAQMRQALAAIQTTGMEDPGFLVGLAETFGKVGQPEEGLAVVTAALAAVPRGRRSLAAESYRLKGQLMLQSTVPGANSQVEEEAEGYFRKAMEIGRQQQAKSLELRAVMNLARLWQHQGKKAEARHLLSEIYGWFTEGFDTKDLQEAKALLQELS